MVLLERIQAALGTGEVLTLRYFGGSTPGAERRLSPISIAGGTLCALCLQSGERKTFVISKLEEVIPGVNSAMASACPVAPAIFPSTQEFTAHHLSALESLGWVVQSSKDGLSLHRRFKNGKMVKTPDVDLSYEATTSDLVFDGEQLIETNTRERSRPWVLRGTGKATKTFAELGTAQLNVLEFASQLAPGVAT